MPGAVAQSGDGAQPAQPIIRIPPFMPAKIKRSGQCDVRYDVTPQGLTENVEVVRCTEPMFARGSMKNVSKWRYAPSDGGQQGVETKISYRFMDKAGEIVPALPMPRRVENPEIAATLKSRGGVKKAKDKHKTAGEYCCFRYGIDGDGQVFGIMLGSCKTSKYDGKREAATGLRGMTFTPAMDGGEAVVTGGGQTLFWISKSKAYLGTDADQAAYCTW